MFDIPLLCLALSVYYEARNEPLVAQVAVAQVVMERVASPRFPNTVCDVVFDGGGGPSSRHRCQFSFYCDGKLEAPMEAEAWEESLRVSSAVLTGSHHTPCLGSTHYHAKYVSPWWADKMTETCRVGKHVFYREGAWF